MKFVYFDRAGNQKAVYEADAVDGTKTTNQILNDINYGIITCQEASGYAIEGIPNRCLVDFEHWSVLNQPMGIGRLSLLEYILMNNVARRQGVDFEILPLPDPWISTPPPAPAKKQQ